MNLKEKIKRITDNRNIKRIRNSDYFDGEYYLNRYPDIKEAGSDPATHYYYFGWKENRDPSGNFVVNNFFKVHPKALISNQNPILYALNHKIKGEFGFDSDLEGGNGKRKQKEEKISVDSLVKAYFFRENAPLKTMVVQDSPQRINVYYNGFNKSCFFGAKATILILAIKFAEKYKYNLRIIAQKPDRSIFYEFLELFNLRFGQGIEFYSTESPKYLEIGEKDHFICTEWVNADSALNTEAIQGKVFDIIQEVETFFFDHGDYHLRCYNTLTSDSLIPIINSKELYKYLVSHGYDNVKNNGIYFKPAFPGELLKPSEGSFKKKSKYKLFFYARPSHQRNLFYFGIDILNKAFLKGVLDTEEWEVYLAGDKTVKDFEFDSNVKVKRLGVISWKEYCNLASKTDLCYSMIYTPHTSYPPLDFASCGAVVLTNKYQNKQSLQNYSKNIISAELNEEDMLKKFKEASLLVKDFKQREENFKNNNINDSWDESFEDILPFMEDKIKEKKDV